MLTNYKENTAHHAVMLCRNALELTKRAVASVLAQDVPVLLHCVDNHSTDGTADWLETQLPRVVTQTFRPALGVSAGWNYALTDIFRTADRAIVLNNDIELRPDCIRSLVEADGGFVTGVGVNAIEDIRGEWTPSRRPHPDFSCFMIWKDTWQRVGAFDESMVLYASDADYHLRMHQAGIEAYTLGIPFFHYASGTLKTASDFERRFIQARADNDRRAFAAKWGFEVGSKEYAEAFTK